MLGEVDWPELTHYMKKTASAYQQAVLKVVITSGEAGRGYARKACSPLNIYVFVFDFPEHYANWRQNGIDSGLARFRLGLNPALAGIKHLNRIEQVMIRQELDSRNEQELIVADINHHIIEASCANVFWLKGSEWMTPDLSNAGVKGILREHILALFPDIKQVSKMSAELHNIRAMFICNAVMGIVPVIRYEEQSLERLPVEAIIERYETYDKH